MKSITTLLAMVIGLAMTNFAHAECPDSLPVHLLVDCIVVEGAGDEYDIQAALEYEEELKKAEASKQLASSE